MRITRRLSITMIVLLVIVALIAIFVPFKCSAQTAGEFNMTFPYSAGVDKAMKRQHGEDWINSYVKPQLREAWKNHRSTAVEAYKQGLSEIFTEEVDTELLTRQESNQLQRLVDSLAIRKARKAQREADSLAAIQTQGANLVPQQEQRISGDAVPMAANVGKALSPRMLLLQDFAKPGTEGGAGGKPPPLPHGYIDGKGLATVAVVIILAVAVAGFAVYGLYYGVKWAVGR